MKTKDKSEMKHRNRRLRVGFLLLLICLCLGACNHSEPTESDDTQPKATESTHSAESTDTTESTEFMGTKEPEATEEAGEPLAVPVFSAEAGFYEELFCLVLTATKEQEIYYTMDGSDPRTSNTAVLYEKEIRIYDNTKEPNRLSNITDITLDRYNPPNEPVDKGIIIRAAIKNADGSFGEVVTNSYFIGKDKSYYTEMQVVSLVTDEDYLFHPDTGFYRVGSGYYEWLESDEYQHYETGDPQNPTNYNKDGKKSEFPASVQVFDQGEAVYSANVGARLSGNWSRSAAQKSFRLYAREEYGTKKMKYAFFKDLQDAKGDLIQSYDKVTMRNSGNDNQTLHFRDAFFQDLTKDLAPDYMAFEPCILFVNGEFWGFYFFREKPDDDYIKAHYGVDKDDVALLKNGEVESGEDSDLEEFNAFCAWARSADMRVPENYERFCEVMDLQSFMDHVTVETYINNADWINGYVNNWQIWHTRTVDESIPKADGKWRFIFYDMDFAGGLYYSENTGYAWDSLNNNRADGSVHDFLAILENLMANPDFAKQFKENYLRIIDTCFAPDVVDELLNRYVESYKEVTQDTFHRFGLGWAADSYETSVAHLREFFHKRPEYAKQYLEAFCSADRTGPKPMVAPVKRWGYYGEASVSIKEEENAFCISVPSATPESWNIQCQAHNITLTKGQEYRLTFKASCTTPGEMNCGINRNDNGEYPGCFWTGFQVTEELQEYNMQFTMEMDTNYDWYLNFNFGNMAGDYVIKDVVMEPVE